MGHHGAERVDAACARALAPGTRSCTSVAAILRNRRDQPAGTAEAPSLVQVVTTTGTGDHHRLHQTITTTGIRSVTKPVTLPFTLHVNGTTAHASGHAQLVRIVFGIGQGPWVTRQWVALDVGVDIELTATRGD